MNREILVKIYAPDSRCWWTCIKYLRKIKKEERKEYKMIEGKCGKYLHYWLEKENEILDPHYDIVGVEVKIEDYKKEKEYEPEYVLSKIDKQSFETLRGVNLEGKWKFVKVNFVNI